MIHNLQSWIVQFGPRVFCDDILVFEGFFFDMHGRGGGVYWLFNF